MTSRALILAVVAVLIASTTTVLVAPGAHAAPAQPAPRGAAPHPSVSTLELRTGSGRCPECNITYYYTYGYGDNVLYFGLYDPTADKSINFSVIDPNATRDGVSQPAFHAEVPNNNKTYEYLSWQTGVSYTFPQSLKIGGWWNVSASAPLGGNVTYAIYVDTYYVETGGAPYPGSSVLPGERINTAWEVLSEANDAPVTSITNVAMDGWFYGTNDTLTNLFSAGIVTLPVTAFGNYSWTVPANATPFTSIVIDLWASIVSNGKIAENHSEEISYSVGEVYIESFYMESSGSSFCEVPSDGYQTYIPSGSYVQACALVGALSEDEFSAVPGLPVSIHFWNGTNIVTPPGNAPTSLTSNATGVVAFSFWANTPQFSTYWHYPFYNSVNLTVTDPSAKPVPASPDFIDNGTYEFYMEPSAASGIVSVTFNQLAYFPGQPITATWAISSTDLNVTGPITAQAWYLYSESTGFIAQGTISSTAATGTIAISLPSGFIGAFGLEVLATNASSWFVGDGGATVQAPVLTLNPSSITYTPGSTVTITALAWGANAIGTATITYEVYQYFEQGEVSYGGGGLAFSGTVANDSSFTIHVPSTGAPSYYYIDAYLSSASAGTVASTSLEIDQAWGYSVLVGVSTASRYSDGSYQPGETITVTYQISPYGNAPLPVVYTFEVYLESTQLGGLVSTTSTSGSLQLTIPSNQPTGIVFIELELVGTYLEGNTCYGGYCYGETAITVNASPSVLSMDLAPGTGFTVGLLILLVIIILVAVIGTVLWLRHRRVHPPSGGGTGGTAVTTPMNPPAPAPSGPGASEWQEPAPPASEGQPPLPTPPPGAT